jgi:hypothetical protein
MSSRNWSAYRAAARSGIIKATPWVASISVIAVLFVVAENIFGDNFHYCVTYENEENSQYWPNYQQIHPSLGTWLFGQVVCSIQLVDNHNGFFALLGTIAVACFTLTLWRSTDKLWKSAEKTARQQLRAYVRAEMQANHTVAIVEGNTVKTCFFIANSGQTPAHSVVVESTICVAKFPLDGPLPELRRTAHEAGSKASVYPTQAPIPVTAEIQTELTADDIARLSAVGPKGEPSEFRFYLYGEIVYKDIFENTWKTPFRGVTEGLSINRARFAWCYEGNEAT